MIKSVKIIRHIDKTETGKEKMDEEIHYFFIDDDNQKSKVSNQDTSIRNPVAIAFLTIIGLEVIDFIRGLDFVFLSETLKSIIVTLIALVSVFVIIYLMRKLK